LKRTNRSFQSNKFSFLLLFSFQSLAASWLEQSLTAMQGEEKDRNGNSRTATVNLLFDYD
jgi:hypothetical protein